jgi:hypothetical protein
MTSKEKAAIRQHWFYLRLKFKSDETVFAQKIPGATWGILYRPHETDAHLKAIGLR